MSSAFALRMNASVTSGRHMIRARSPLRGRKVNIRWKKSGLLFKKSIRSVNAHQIRVISSQRPCAVTGAVLRFHPLAPPPLPAYLQEPVAGLADEGESHGSLGHGQLAVSVPRRRPSELPQLLGDGEEQGHGHQAGGQRGQSRDQVEGVEQHGDGELGDLPLSLELWVAFKKTVESCAKIKKGVNLND